MEMSAAASGCRPLTLMEDAHQTQQYMVTTKTHVYEYHDTWRSEKHTHTNIISCYFTVSVFIVCILNGFRFFLIYFYFLILVFTLLVTCTICMILTIKKIIIN